MIDSTKAVMFNYFQLKQERGRIKQERVEFMKNYRCLKPHSNDSYERPSDCILWYINGGQLEYRELCEPCKKRHSFYVRLKENSNRRASITRRINALPRMTGQVR